MLVCFHALRCKDLGGCFFALSLAVAQTFGVSGQKPTKNSTHQGPGLVVHENAANGFFIVGHFGHSNANFERAQMAASSQPTELGTEWNSKLEQLLRFRFSYMGAATAAVTAATAAATSPSAAAAAEFLVRPLEIARLNGGGSDYQQPKPEHRK